jgi:putative peptidoglycan lipid II flippase
MQLPETIIGTAFGLVAFPTLAELAARHDLGRLRSTLAETVRSVVALTVPAAVGLILLGQPLLSFLYERGQFDAAAVDAVYATLRFFALGLVGHSVLELAARAFFAQQDTVTPLIVAIVTAVLAIGLGIVLMAPLGAGGLALGNSVAITVEVLLLMAILRKRWGGVEGGAILRSLLRVLLASAIMGLAVAAVLLVAQANGYGAFVQLLAGGLVGLVVYVVAGLLVGVRELRLLPAALFGR